MTDDFAAQVSGVSALADPVRRALYQYVAGRAEPVSREQAANDVAVARHTAKFHLDRLVEEGLLDVEYRRLSGRRGPGAGRPSKLYRRSGRQLTVTLPERRYDLAGQLLAGAVERSAREGVPVLDALADAATAEGARLAAAPADDGPPLEETARVLSARGYEARLEGSRVVLANCPFHDLAREHTELVCGMNLDLIAAFLRERGYRTVAARLDPAEQRCCVTLTADG